MHGPTEFFCMSPPVDMCISPPCCCLPYPLRLPLSTRGFWRTPALDEATCRLMQLTALAPLLYPAAALAHPRILVGVAACPRRFSADAHALSSPTHHVLTSRPQAILTRVDNFPWSKLSLIRSLALSFEKSGSIDALNGVGR